MRDNIFVSVVLPVYNESDRINNVLLSLLNQKTLFGMITHETYELIIVDNNSTDDSIEKINALNARNPLMDIHIIKETIQGVSSARKRGMDYASLRSKARDSRLGVQKKHYIVSADADCTVDPYWLHALIEKMVEENGDLGTCNYYYNEESFRHRPNLFREMQKTLRCRDMSFSLLADRWLTVCTSESMKLSTNPALSTSNRSTLTKPRHIGFILSSVTKFSVPCDALLVKISVFPRSYRRASMRSSPKISSALSTTSVKIVSLVKLITTSLTAGYSDERRSPELAERCRYQLSGAARIRFSLPPGEQRISGVCV
ncbi:glycosyltransferase family 2 protein [Sinorhizobium psoraleae]|uniref:glycosyltransferase family 2 protein n=1 Tax=Sinorhizobium psoraleae TaxID=520838 RepID=UPI001AED8516|nr:glycosyltransferase family 2 protein [Sinorhizobium psoraleae]